MFLLPKKWGSPESPETITPKQEKPKTLQPADNGFTGLGGPQEELQEIQARKNSGAILSETAVGLRDPTFNGTDPDAQLN